MLKWVSTVRDIFSVPFLDFEFFYFFFHFENLSKFIIF